MTDIEERIAEAREEVSVLCKFGYPNAGATFNAAYNRLVERARKKAADLEAVRDGKAVEVYATVSVDQESKWGAYGSYCEGPRDRDVLEVAGNETGDRITILRGIAFLPVSDTSECEAESEAG